MPSSRRPPTGSETARARRDALMPALLLADGRVMTAGPKGLVPARTDDGRLYDVLDVADQLAASYGRIYLVDLDGIDHDRPQLDYIQEIARTAEVWVDAGIRTSDQAIDVVVAGAYRTVLTTSQLESAAELDRSWKLSSEIALDIVWEGERVRARDAGWATRSPSAVATDARTRGPTDLLLTAPARPIDWSLVGAVAKGGTVWVGGSFVAEDLARAKEAGATGGILSIDAELGSVGR